MRYRRRWYRDPIMWAFIAGSAVGTTLHAAPLWVWFVAGFVASGVTDFLRGFFCGAHREEPWR